MPVISRFYGISIMMFFKDHNPPHFHAKYEGQVAVFHIQTHRLMAGKLPPHALRLTREWLKIHERELSENWRRAQNDRVLRPIQPLV
jgi:hypothetical protein